MVDKKRVKSEDVRQSRSYTVYEPNSKLRTKHVICRSTKEFALEIGIPTNRLTSLLRYRDGPQAYFCTTSCGKPKTLYPLKALREWWAKQTDLHEGAIK